MADGPSLPGIDVAALLAPIAPGAPTGVDLRKQPKSIFLEIEGLLDGKGVPDVIVADSEGRKSSLRDERALSQSVTEGLSRAVETLTKQSKDLEVATLCVQGLLSVHGYAGVMWAANYGTVQYTMGFMPGLKAFVAAVFGGIGNLGGAVVGGLLLGLIESIGSGYLGELTGDVLGSHYSDIFAFVVLILMLTIRPSGLLGERVADRA